MLGALLIGVFIYRELPVRDLYRILRDSVSQTSVVAHRRFLGSPRLVPHQRADPAKICRMILETTSNKYLILLFLNLFFFVAGMFLHSAAAII